ncbi:predicted protein [Chaetoceros tenuissimus]|uniref:Uncharacterized protein n=1 Tax=Chaetoceros tenuissimus TaxID=426638 RepID=A0AAD3CYI7_9STRA|nr:predicted protein [Chaetoceros tenuissimus]
MMIQCIYGMTPFKTPVFNSRNSIQDGQTMKHSRDETQDDAGATTEKQPLPVMDHRSASIYVTFHTNGTISRPFGYDIEYQVQIKEVRRLSQSHSFFSHEEEGYQYQPLSETKSIWTWSDSSQDVLQHTFTKRISWDIPIQSCVNSEGTVIAYSHCEEMYYVKLWRVAKALHGQDGNDDLKLIRYAFVERKYLDTSPLYVHLHIPLDVDMMENEERVFKMMNGKESASVPSMPTVANFAVKNSDGKDAALETDSVNKSERQDHGQTSNYKVGMMRGSRLGQTSPRAATATIETKKADIDSNAVEWAILLSLLGLTISMFSMIHVMSQKKSEERDQSIIIDMGSAPTPNDSESVPNQVVRQNFTNIVSPIHTPSSPLRRNSSKNIELEPLDEVSQSSKHEMDADNEFDDESHAERPWRRVLDEQVEISETHVNEGDTTDKVLFSPPFMKRLEKPNSPLFQDTSNLHESNKLSFDCTSPKKDMTHEMTSSPQAEMSSSNSSKNAVDMKDHQPGTISNQSQKSIEAIACNDETDQTRVSCKSKIEIETNEDVLISKRER